MTTVYSGKDEESSQPLNENDENSNFRDIFRQCDTDNNGYICIKELDAFFNRQRHIDKIIPEHIMFTVHRRADKDGDEQLNYDEFVDLVTNRKFQDLMHYHIDSYVKFLIPIPKQPKDEFQLRSIGISKEVVDSPEEIEDDFAGYYTCYPPPMFIISITVFQIVYYFVDPLGEQMLYDPNKRQEFWRFFTYAFIHVSIHHLLMNMLVQVCLGIPLEMVNKWWRLIIIYITGAIGGSTLHSVVERDYKLVGASGSVYAIMTAHVANVIINWSQMRYPIIQLMVFSFLAFYDLGFSIYNHYILNIETNVGIMAHLGGAMSGLLVGIYTLRNIKTTSFEIYIWWIALTIYIIFLGSVILINILVL